MLKITNHQAETFLDFVHEWLDLLYKQAFGKAADLLDEPNRFGHNWTADEFRLLLRQPPEDGLPPSGERLRMVLERERTYLAALERGQGYVLEYSVPLYLPMKCSELALKFEFRSQALCYAVILEDMWVK